MHALWGKWAPPKERSILAAVTFSGVSVIIMNDYQQQLMSVIIIDNWHTIYTYIPQSEPCLYTDAGL